MSLSGNYDEVDHFVSFKFSFADLVSNLASRANDKVTLTKDTSLRYVLATATNSNSFNSDIGGYNGSADSTTTFVSKGVFSTTGSFSNAAPIITSNGGGTTATFNVVAGGTTATTVVATDANTDDTITYSISGDDVAWFNIDSSSGVLTFKANTSLANNSASGNDTYEVTVTASDGTDTDTQALSISVIGSNSAPTLTDSTISGTEDTTITFAASNFSDKFSDDDNNSLTKIKVTSLPSNGTLRLNGASVSANDEITVAQIPNLTFVPNDNWNGSTTLNWKGHDGTVYSTSAATMTLSIAAVNDLPTLTNSTKNGDQDTTMTFTAANFTDKYSDTESSALTKIQITSIPSNGTLKLNGTAVSANDEITAANLANLTFEPNSGWNGSTTLSWKGHDGTAYSSSAATMTLDIAAATTNKKATLTLLNTNPQTTTTNPAAGAGKSDENDNTISGTSGNQGNDKDVGNAGGNIGNNTNKNTNNNLKLIISDDVTYNPAAGAGGSDENDNTISGTSGNQGNDKDVGNAGGNKSKTKDDKPPEDKTKPIFTSSKADVRLTDSGAKQFVMTNIIGIKVEAKVQLTEDGEAADEVEPEEINVKIESLPQNGTVSHDSKGGFVYVAKIGFEGTDSFSYTVQDGQGNTIKGTITVDTTTGAVTHTQSIVGDSNEQTDRTEQEEGGNEDEGENKESAPIEGNEGIETLETSEQETDENVSELEGDENEKIAEVMGKEVLTLQAQIEREAGSFDTEVDDLLELLFTTT